VASRCDFDGDGRSDLFINYLPINLNPQRYAAALWQDGGFRIEELSVRGRNEYLLPQCAMDLNGDGLLESTGEESGPGPGQFGRMIAYQFDPSASRLTELPLRGDVPGRCDELRALGDFDGDGYGDFVCHRPSSDLGRWVTSIFFGSMSLELQEVVILESDRLAPGVVAVYF
jgi:hypothetical protein